jgi:hypothetical protein
MVLRSSSVKERRTEKSLSLARVVKWKAKLASLGPLPDSANLFAGLTRPGSRGAGPGNCGLMKMLWGADYSAANSGMSE